MLSFINIFRIIAFFEGISFIALLFYATPMKHFYDDPQYVKMLGMPHGILFILYVVIAIMLRKENSWFKNNFKFVMLAAILPFGTFILERKIPKTQ